MNKIINWYWAIFHFWMRFPEKIRFVLVGGYNSVVSYLLYLLFLWLFGDDRAQMALFCSFFASSPNSYFTQKIYVFNTSGNYWAEYIKCLGTWSIGYVLNAILLGLLIFIGLDPRIAQAIALMLVAVSNYILLKHIAFQKKEIAPLHKVFIILMLCHFALWSVIPCLRQMLPLDTIEAIFWGTINDWGTNKHPPLSGVMAYGAWVLGGRTDMVIYMLSQVCVLCGLVFIFKIGKLFLTEKKALLATMLMEGIIYYNFQTVEYNVNVVSLALWPICTYFFLKAVRENEWTDWVFLGVFSGLNILNKYVCGILFLCMAAYLFLTQNGRDRLKGRGPYLAFAVAGCLVLPHILWLFETDFMVIEYFLERGSSVAYRPVNHLLCPMLFLAGQLAFCAPVFLLYFLCARKSERVDYNKAERVQLFFVGILPLLLTTCVSAVLGTKLKTMWGFPLLYLATVALFYYVPRSVQQKQTKCFIRFSFIFLLMLALGYMGQIALNKNRNFQTQPQKLIAELEEIWHREFPNRPLKLVAGHTWWTSMLYVYNPETETILYHMKPQSSRWFPMGKIQKNGLMVMSEDPQEFKAWQQQFPTLSGPYLFKQQTQNWFGQKSKIKNMYYGFMKE